METKKIVKSYPHACPVCKGKGELGPELAQYDALPKYDGSDVYSCHICSGQGIIWEYREELMKEEPQEETAIPSTGNNIPTGWVYKKPIWTLGDAQPSFVDVVNTDYDFQITSDQIIQHFDQLNKNQDDQN